MTDTTRAGEIDDSDVSQLIYDWNSKRYRGPVIANRAFELHDETLRDGIQNPSVVDPEIEDKLEILHMLEEIGHPRNIQAFVERAKDKDDPFRLMGFGHRVYKNYDPRAKIIYKACHDLIDEMGVNQPLFEIAMELERIALEDDYFIERRLYPNVDFYSGLIYQALNIPTSMFTNMFALARCAGWIAQWNELMGDPDFRIGRPRQLYVGARQRDYVPLDKRG